ncbi:MAG: TonB-dependent receptor [Pseudomonadota bacterium]
MRNFKGLRRSAISSALTFGALMSVATNPLFAQEDAFLEEIVVTAAKREQTLQEVPISVSVTDADTVEKAVILDVIDLQTVVPSLRVSQLQSTGNTNFLIRGFGNGANNPGIEPSVGVFIDGVYRSRSASALSDLPNLERIEVLRGPQSTLFGKNASAGVISVVTQAPQFEAGGSVEVLAGNFGSTVFRGNVTGPLSETVAFSLSGNYNQRDGYFDNFADGSEINERNRYGVRGDLLFEPNETFSLRVIADFDEIDENCCGTTNLFNGPTGGAVQLIGGNLVPNDPFSYGTFINFDSDNEIENSGLSAQMDFDYDNFSITSITAFRNQSAVSNADSDFTSADLIGRNFEDRDIDTFTQELRLTTSFGEKTDFLFGIFYAQEDVQYNTALLYGADFRAYGELLAAAGGADPNTFSDLEAGLGLPAGTFFAPGAGARDMAEQDDESLSIFANFDFYLTDRATLTVGANYTTVEKDIMLTQNNTDVFSQLDFAAIGVGLGLPPALANVPCSATNPPPACNALLALRPFQFLPQALPIPNSVESGTSDDSDVTYTLRFAYDLTDSLNAYVSYGTGFKATSWNLSRDSRPIPADLAALQAASLASATSLPGTRFAAPEETTVYEIGLKGSFDRGNFALTLFDQSIEGFQSNVFTGTGFNLINAGEQSTEGLEFESLWYATDQLQINFALMLLDPVFDEFPNSSVGDLTGTAPPGVSETSASLAATYSWELSNGWSAFARGDYQYESDVRVIENVPEQFASREVGLLNASFGIATPGGWEFGLWGRNLTEDEFLQSAFPTVAQEGSFNGYPNAPRTYGLSIRKTFGQ